MTIRVASIIAACHLMVSALWAQSACPQVSGLTTSGWIGEATRVSRNCGDLSALPVGTITFDWRPVSGATRYEWEIYSAASGARLQSGFSTSASASVNLPAGRYHWRVRAFMPLPTICTLPPPNPCDTPCAWSNACEFVVGDQSCPTIQPQATVSPGLRSYCGDQASLPSGQHLQIWWQAVSGVSGYEAELYRVEGGANQLVEGGTITNPSLDYATTSRPIPAGRYFWRIRAYRVPAGIVCVQPPCANTTYCPWSSSCSFMVGETCTITACGSANVPPTGRIAEALTFTASPPATSGCSNPPAYSWVFGDGTTGSGQTVTKAYGSAGRYTWRVTMQAGSGGPTCERTGEIVVGPSGPVVPTRVVVTRLPQGMVQQAGSATATDSFVVTNAGNDPASISVTARQTFFTVDPSSFLLPAGATQTVTIRSNTQASGMYDGAVSVFANNHPVVDLPVRLFVGQRPSGPVSPLAEPIPPLIGPPGQTQSGTFRIANSGSSAMRAVMTADVPWIIPQQGLVVVEGGTQASATFQVDPSLRPDAEASVGTLRGTVTLTYMTATGVAKTSLTVVSVTRTSPVPAEPPPFAPGEVGLFLPGISDLTNIVNTDMLLAPRADGRAPRNVRVFYLPHGSGAQSSRLNTINQLPASIGTIVERVLPNLFNVGNQNGGLQIRSGDLENLLVAAWRLSAPDGRNVYLTTVPTIRSDMVTAAGEPLIWGGLERNDAAQTDILLQETAGYPSAYRVEFFDDRGVALAPDRTGALPAFGSAIILDAAPVGARSARITQTTGSDSRSRLAGHASVVDRSTGDAWTVVETPATRESTFIIPLPSFVNQQSEYEIFITNRTTAPVQVAVSNTAGAVRRRAVRRSDATASPLPIVNDNITLAARETRRMAITDLSAGYIRLTAPAGSITATGRLKRTASGRAGTFGTTLPAVPSSMATAGGTRFFPRAYDGPGYSTASLFLINSLNQAARVRATVRFILPSATLTTGVVRVAREYDIPPGQTRTIHDLIRDLIGPQRDSLGTISNLVISVETLSGAVLPLIGSVEGSGDIVLTLD